MAHAGENGLADSLTIDTALLSGAGNITIYNNPSTATVRIGSTEEPDNHSLEDDYTPHPDLRIMGNIDNVNGDGITARPPARCRELVCVLIPIVYWAG